MRFNNSIIQTQTEEVLLCTEYVQYSYVLYVTCAISSTCSSIQLRVVDQYDTTDYIVDETTANPFSSIYFHDDVWIVKMLKRRTRREPK